MNSFSIRFVYFIIFSFVVSISNGQYKLAKFSNWGYVISETKETWKKANQICRDKNMLLLSLESEEKSKELNDYLNSQGFVDGRDTGTNYIYWTSGNDMEEEGEFVWDSTGNKLTFTNWLPGMPDNWRKDENCIEMGFRQLGKWNDNRCWYERPYICESKLAKDDSNF